MLKQALIAACLLGALGAPLRAQEMPAPVPPGPPSAPAPETKAERQKNNAAKLAGLLFFVQNACPEAQPDYERFKTVVAGLGVELDDLSKGDLLLRSRAYTETYTKDTPANCARAVQNFGETGTTIPGLIKKR